LMYAAAPSALVLCVCCLFTVDDHDSASALAVSRCAPLPHAVASLRVCSACAVRACKLPLIHAPTMMCIDRICCILMCSVRACPVRDAHCFGLAQLVLCANDLCPPALDLSLRAPTRCQIAHQFKSSLSSCAQPDCGKMSMMFNRDEVVRPLLEILQRTKSMFNQLH